MRDPSIPLDSCPPLDRQTQADSLEEPTRAQMNGRHEPVGLAHVGRVRLRCDRGQKTEALAELRSTCLLPGCEETAIAAATTAFQRAGWARDAELLFYEILGKPGVNPEVGAQWVILFTQRGAWNYRRRLYGIDFSTLLGRRACAAYLGATGTYGKANYLEKLLSRDPAALRADPQCWGQAGYAYTSCGLFKEAVAWLGDWTAHPEAQPWMLFNLALAQRSIGKTEEALVVNKAALALPTDRTTPLHALWVALEEAIGGSFDSARARLESLAIKELSDIDRAVHALTMALVSVNAASAGERATVFDQQKSVLCEQSLQNAFANATLRSTAKRAIADIAKAAGEEPFRVGQRMLPGPVLSAALEDAVEGRFDTARAQLEMVPKQGLKAYDQAVHALTTALIKVNAASAEERTIVFEQHRSVLCDPALQKAFASRALHSTARRAVFSMAKAAGARPFRVGHRLPSSPSLTGEWGHKAVRSKWRYLWYTLLSLVILFFLIVLAAKLCCKRSPFPEWATPLTDQNSDIE